MKIMFCLAARLGDVCCGIPTFYALREKYPDAELLWATLNKYEPLLPPFAKFVKVGPPPFGATPPNKGYNKFIKAQPMWRHREWERSKMHIIDLIAKWSDIKLRRRRIIIRTTKADENVINNIRLPKKFATICASPCYSCADWSHSQRRHIVKTLVRQGYGFVTVGGKDGKVIPGATCLHGKLSFTQTIALINRSRVYIGQDTGPTWLACAAHSTPKICVIDRNRLRQGKCGFQKYLNDKNIIDTFYNEGVDKHIRLIKAYWK